MASPVPVVDLSPWRAGGQAGRSAVAAEVDAALQEVGFFLITGHGVPGDLRIRVRAEARAFFGLPPEIKQRYAVTVGGRGWMPTGVEANAYAEGTQTPPDLKESFTVGSDEPTGDFRLAITLNGNPVVGMRLKVRAEGIEPFEADTKALIGRLDIPQIQPGAELSVMYDPEDHTRVALDIYDERK